jgi:hypothetical protein
MPFRHYFHFSDATPLSPLILSDYAIRWLPFRLLRWLFAFIIFAIHSLYATPGCHIDASD